jgi:signal transduction histidine kinase
LAEVRRTIREQSGDYLCLKVFYPTADKGKKSANKIFVIGLELGAVEISVSDTGIGISPEDQAKIFEEFRQVGGRLRSQEGRHWPIDGPIEHHKDPGRAEQ